MNFSLLSNLVSPLATYSSVYILEDYYLISYLFPIKIITNINIFSTPIGIGVLSYRDRTLIITINNYRFELGFTGAYGAKKTPKLDYFLSSLGLSNIFGFVYREGNDSLPFRYLANSTTTYVKNIPRGRLVDSNVISLI